MRIRSCHISAFGQLRDLTIDDLDHPIVVIHGPNEAGKSTFFQFLKTMLFGIYPTDPEKHELVPRAGGYLEGRLRYAVVGSEEDFEVSRKLMTTPRGQLSLNGRSQDLRNAALPQLSHVSRRVFESVYALSLYDLTALTKNGAWEEVQERMTGGLSIDFIRPARRVAAEIDAEAGALWRDSARGKQEAAIIRKRLAELRAESAAAAERDRRARAVNDELAQLERHLHGLQEERISLAARRRRIERLAPVRSYLRKIEEADREAGDPELLRQLPADPDAEIEQIARRLEAVASELSGLDRSVEQAERDAAPAESEEQRLIAHAEAIRSWGKRSGALLDRKNRLQEQRKELSHLEARLIDRAGSFLNRWDLTAEAAIKALPLPELREAIAVFSESDRRLGEAEASEVARMARFSGRRPVLLWTLAAFAAAVIASAAAVMSLPLVTGAAAAVAIALAAVALMGWRHNLELGREAVATPLDRLRDERRERQRNVAALLTNVPLPAPRLEKPDAFLVQEISGLQDLLAGAEGLRDRIAAMESDLASSLADIRGLFKRVVEAEAAPDSDAADLIARLERLLNDAEERRRRRVSAERLLAELRPRSQRLRMECTEAERRRTEIQDLLGHLGGNGMSEQLRILDHRRRAHRRSESFRLELEREYPDLDEVVAELERLEDAQEEWSLSDEERIRLDERMQELNDEITTVSRRHTELGKDLERILEMPTLAAVQSEQDHLRQELETVERRRDRLALLSSIISAADARFREKHQPDVIRRAGDYLSKITAGRYTRLDLLEEERRLLVFESDEPFGYPAETPLSQGTRDQVFLALRLATVDHLDDGHEHLPLFLDEVFVNWDEERRSQGYHILRQVSENRQIFVFTCHAWLIDELAAAVPTQTIDLRLCVTD